MQRRARLGATQGSRLFAFHIIGRSRRCRFRRSVRLPGLRPFDAGHPALHRDDPPTRNFMSAARAAARNKPVLAIKAGRDDGRREAAASHTGARPGADAVYDAALRRAGMLRVYDLDEMFTAVETLAPGHVRRAAQLAVLTNGGGVGVHGRRRPHRVGRQASRTHPGDDRQTERRLAAALVARQSSRHIGDAGGERYVKALDVLLEVPEVDFGAGDACTDRLDQSRSRSPSR